MPILVFKAKDFIVLLIVYFTLLDRTTKYCTKINLRFIYNENPDYFKDLSILVFFKF